MMGNAVISVLIDEMFDTTPLVLGALQNLIGPTLIRPRLQEEYFHPRVDYMDWIEKYNETVFFQLFRMKKETFSKLLNAMLEKDVHCLIKKKYRGGNYPFAPEKNLLIFLWYMAHNDSLVSIADRFGVVPPSVMGIVNGFLYIICRLKYKYIKWPVSEVDRNHIKDGFPSFPGVVGAIDGTHINLKVPVKQHDSYIDRYQRHSINATAVCTAEKIFTYVFVGFPGSAHDARVFSHSNLFKEIEQNGTYKYFPTEDCHIIGDGAYPLRTWLMVPFKGTNLNERQKYFNYCLSSARVNIENAFAFLKSRWARLFYINTNSVSKAVEICIAACVLHNFCMLNHDSWDWDDTNYQSETTCEDFGNDDRMQNLMGEFKRSNILRDLWNARNQRRN